MTAAPFEQLAYDDVPDLPRLPHRWAEAVRRDVMIRTPDFTTETRIAVHEYGTGEPLVLVHGLMTAGYSFRYLLDAARRSLSPDRSGSARRRARAITPTSISGPTCSRAPSSRRSMRSASRGATVIGNSMGGYLCMRAAMLDPAAIGRLVNLHSPGLPTARMTALRWALRLLPARFLVERLVRRDPERWVHKNVHYYDETLKSREEHREFAAPLTTPAGRRAFYRHLHDALDVREMKRFAAALRAAPFPIPLLLVYAERDPMVPPIVGDAAARARPGRRLHRARRGLALRARRRRGALRRRRSSRSLSALTPR